MSIKDTRLHAGPAAGDADADFLLAANGQVPPVRLDEILQRLYGNIHSTLAHLQIYGGLDDSTFVYLDRRHGEPAAALLVRRDGDTARVINEGMRIGDGALERFCAHLFSAWPEIRAIHLHAVQSEAQPLRYPCQQHACTADIVLPLPPTVDEYVASLGKNMRRNLRRYMDKLERDHPDMAFEVYEGNAIREQDARDIIALNRARIAGKQLRYNLDDEADKVIALAKACGMAIVMRIGGRVAGGSIGYFAGTNYFFKIIAHDPAYNEYSAGILCCYRTICECIARRCAEYNFMWNEYEYKFALGARARSLQDVVVYRSRLHALVKPGLAAARAAEGLRYRALVLLEKARRQEELTQGERWALASLNGLRSARRLMAKLRPGRGVTS